MIYKALKQTLSRIAYKMVVLRTVFICAVIVTPYLVYAETPNKVDLDVLRWKFDILIREAKLTTDAVRNINIRTAADKLQLANMITSYIQDLSLGKNSLNVVVPNLVNTNGYSIIVNATEALNMFITTLQHLVNENPNSAKKGLVSFVDSIKESFQLFLGRIEVPNDFAAMEFNSVLNSFIYGLYKTKIQSMYFEETNKELVPRITAAIKSITESIKKFASTDKKAFYEYRRLSTLLQLITERVVSRLENWIEINSKNTKGVKIALEIIANMRENLSKEIHALTDLHTTEDLKLELGSIYVSGAKEIQKLGEIEYEENNGGQEYIRTTLFDAIVIPTAFGENINNMPYRS